jgi:Flp pilus assembly protein TadG
MITRLLRDERGSVTVESALWLLPAVLVVFGLVQIALWWAAVDTCSAAAQDGLDAGRVVGGSPATAQRTALGYMARVQVLARSPQVSTAGTTNTEMRVAVSADVVLLVPIPGWQWHVERVVVGTREHPTNPGES